MAQCYPRSPAALIDGGGTLEVVEVTRVKRPRYDVTRARRMRAKPRDYTHLPDDHPDLDKLFLAVDVSRTAPPGTEASEANWVVRYGAG